MDAMADLGDWNARIIEEFRANDGEVGGPFEGAHMLLLHHRGARTGIERINPLVFQPVGDAMGVFASKGGAPTNPDWFHNLVAHPRVVVERGTQTVEVGARVATDEERAPIWERQKRDRPTFADYERKTSRVIPVVLLEPVP
jgi:deazaflavin-dependent oxidoreductase (nitroreductase family)